MNEAFLEALGEHRDRYVELESSPHDLLELVRSDDAFREALVRADTLPLLTTWFTGSADGWRADTERSGRLGEAAAGTEWSFDGLHEADDVFNGIRATGRSVVVRGFTILSIEEELFKVRRYVDWAGLYGQLGLAVNWRVPVENVLPPDERLSQLEHAWVAEPEGSQQQSD
jgi:hypothetical protein